MKLKNSLLSRLAKTKAQPRQDEIGHQDDMENQDEAAVTNAAAEHKPTLSRNIHWVVIAFVALAIGGATYYTSANKQTAASQAAAEKIDAPGMSPEDARRKADSAGTEIAGMADRQVQEAEKQRSLANAAPATKPSNEYQSPFKTPVTTSTPSQPSGTIQPPPPPPQGAQPTPIDDAQVAAPSQYNPASISELNAAQGGGKDGGVQQRTSAIIALTGVSNSTSGGTTPAGQTLGIDTANAMSGAVNQLVEAVSNNKAAIFAPVQQKMYPAQADLEQLRARLQEMQTQYGAGMATPASTLPSMKGQSMPQAMPSAPGAPVVLPPQLPRSQYIEAAKYDGRLLIRQGKYIPAAFLTAINSDLPGDISAIVTENVYDSVGGDTLLIPKGSMLMATYGSDTLVGQERVLISFSRIVLPNGDSVDIGNMNGIDTIGQSGANAEVNNHFLKQFGAGFIGAVVAWGVDKATGSDITINTSDNSQTDLSTSSGKILKDLTERILDRYRNLKPTLTVAPGEKIRLYVGKDIAMQAYR